ncbi:hypothetical protein C1141_19580, partial [Vibrio agarivorans]
APPPPPPPPLMSRAPLPKPTVATQQSIGVKFEDQLAAKVAARAGKMTESKTSEKLIQTARATESGMTDFDAACRSLADGFDFTLDAVQYMSTLATEKDLSDPSDIKEFKDKFSSSEAFRQKITDKAVLNLFLAPFGNSHGDELEKFKNQVTTKLDNDEKLDLKKEFSRLENQLSLSKEALGNTIRSHYLPSAESSLNTLIKANNKLLTKKSSQHSGELQVKLSDISNARLNEPKTYLSLLKGELTSKELPRDKAENLVEQLASTLPELDVSDRVAIKAMLADLLARMS